MKATFELDRDYYKNIYCIESEYNRCDPHFHSNIEIVYVIDGEINANINNQNKILKPGYVSIANSFDIHNYFTPEYSRSYVLIIPTDLINSFSTLSQTKTFTSCFMDPCSQSEEIKFAAEKLLKYNDTRNSISAKGYIYVILGILIENLGLYEREVKSSSETLMQNILMYLEKTYTSHITLSDLANHFGYNKDYLSRMFNSKLGCGINQYINVLRARHAAHLIQNSKLSLSEISYQSGFGSSRTFNRAFQSFYNITPLEYKQNIDKNR